MTRTRYGNNDQRHRTVTNGMVDLPWGIQVSGIFFASSALPVNITTGVDNNRNGVPNDRPDLVRRGAGFRQPVRPRQLRCAGHARGNLVRNAARGPGYWQIDLRVQKVFTIRRSRLDLLVEAFNLTNHVNLFNQVGNLTSVSFGRSIQADIARQVQLGIRVGF